MTLDQVTNRIRALIDSTDDLYTSSYGEPSCQSLSKYSKFFVSDDRTGTRYYVVIGDEPYVESPRGRPNTYDGYLGG